MPNDELQEIREAKVSVELHLADTLNCLGYCHDAKLSEYEKSLMAYQESLSLYIRHVGRFHQTVSNALHNMGAIHVELGQWKEAASCFRQCLSILKRKKEKELANSSQESEQSQMFVTLQSLGNSLAEYGDFDASIDKQRTKRPWRLCWGDTVSNGPGAFQSSFQTLSSVQLAVPFIVICRE
jgi:tetratricopeptide (TPR) repeat protein